MKGMSPIVKNMARLVAGFIAIYGMYVILYGHLSPGGGFVGGVILACSPVLLLLAYGREFTEEIIGHRGALVWDCLGALGFLAIALAGYAGGQFFYNLFGKGERFRLISGGIIPFCNLAIGVKVGACLFGVFLILAIFRVTQSSKE